MTRFLPASRLFSALVCDSFLPLELLPFRYRAAKQTAISVSNMVGEFIRLQPNELENGSFELELIPGDGLYEKASAAHLITRADPEASGSFWRCGSGAEWVIFLPHAAPYLW